jgi:hypothetical protein
MHGSPLPRHFLIAAILAAFGTVSIAGQRSGSGRGAVPGASISGPIASAPIGDSSRNYPFYASIVDLKARGYVEEEFFIEGTAARYETPPQADGRVLDAGHPYKTRLVVRRPADAARFNGIVVLEWNNVTAGYDLDIDWFQSHDYFIRKGFAWVGTTPQRIGVEALKVWSPSRYGTLDVTAGGRIENDALSFDIFTQIARAIRTPGGVRVLGPLGAERIFATGHSQSAGRLATYANSVHPLVHAVDAIVVHGGGGRIRADLDIPVFKLLAETDVLGSQAANRQPNTARFRSWEVAGTSHVDLQFVASSRQLRERDGSPNASGGLGGRGARGATSSAASAAPGRGAAPPPAAPANAGGCDRPPYSHIPFHYVMNAAFDHLVRWVRDGVAPPVAPPIDTVWIGPPAVPKRDARGNATGGIQLPQHAVPTAVNTGQNSGPGFCRLNGSHEPFDAATLSALYPTRDAYTTAFRRAADAALRGGYILAEDMDAMVRDAGQQLPGAR